MQSGGESRGCALAHPDIKVFSLWKYIFLTTKFNGKLSMPENVFVAQ